MAGLERFPNIQGILDDVNETVEHLKTDEEGREAVLAGISMGLREMRGGELAPHDVELVEGLKEDPIGAIKVLRVLRESGLVDAA